MNNQTSTLSRIILTFLLPTTIVLFDSFLYADWWQGSSPFGDVSFAIIVTAVVGILVSALLFGPKERSLSSVAHTFYFANLLFVSSFIPILRHKDTGEVWVPLAVILPFLVPVFLILGALVSRWYRYLLRDESFRLRVSHWKKMLANLALMLFVIGLSLNIAYAVDRPSCGTALGVSRLTLKSDGNTFCLITKARAGDWRACLLADNEADQRYCQQESDSNTLDSAVCASESVGDSDYCYSHMAVKLKDSTLCGQIKNESQKFQCLAMTTDNFDPKLCDSSPEKDTCLSTLAEKNKDIGICELMTDQYRKNACISYTSKLLFTDKLNVCFLKSEEDKFTCLKKVIDGEKNLQANYCSPIGYEDILKYCWSKAAN